MAMAAKRNVAPEHEIAALGELDPEHIDVTPAGLKVIETFGGIGLEALRALTGVPLLV